MRAGERALWVEPRVTFRGACELLEEALSGSVREEILDGLGSATDLGRALLRLRRQLRGHVLRAGRRDVDLAEIARDYDARTRHEGFHVLHDWDGISERFNEDVIAVDVLNYLVKKRGRERTDRAALAVLLDYYFLYVLALLSLRIWDEGDADENLDRLGRLVAHLQGPRGSGQGFVSDPETLILVAISNYEPEERAYHDLLAKVRTLDRVHRARLARATAVIMGSHLRFGFAATYGEDMVAMRDDNSVDYAWLCFALATLMAEYARLRQAGAGDEERDGIAEAILNGLCSDAEAFFGEAPAVVWPYEADRAAFLELFDALRPHLLSQWERYVPGEQSYSPLSFRFNFPHNVVKGAVVDALLWGEAWSVTLDDLLTDRPRPEPAGRTREGLARTLTRQARAAPSRIRGRPMPVIVYDAKAGREAFAETTRWVTS